MTSLLALALLAPPKVLRDIPYARQSPAQKLDLYRPDTPNGIGFVAIHGGGFVGGSKGGNTAEICRYLSQRGITAIDINYRLKPKNGGSLEQAVRTAVDDASSALKMFREYAPRLGVDPNKIAIGGSSAGAITSLFATYERRERVTCVIDLWGGLYGQESNIRRGDPALLIVHGRNDRTVAFSLAEALAAQATRSAVPFKFLQNDGGHTLALGTTFEGKSLLEHIHEFVVVHSSKR